MAKDLAIVLNSGSVNSAVATAVAAQKYRVILLHAETGVPSARRRSAFDQQSAHFRPYREHVLPMPYLSAVQPSSMGGTTSLPLDPRHPAALAPRMLELLPLVAVAGRFAGHYQASAIYLGLCVGPGGDELSQATEYVQIWNELLTMPCGQGELELLAPLAELEPWQVIDVGVQVGAPFERTWSCIEESAEPCWACQGCRAREHAFSQAAKPDPLRAARKG